MCLAIPLKLLTISADGREGVVDMGGAEKVVGLDLTPQVRPGDYVLVHAGMAIETMDEEEAETTLAAFREFASVPGLLAPGTDDGP